MKMQNDVPVSMPRGRVVISDDLDEEGLDTLCRLVELLVKWDQSLTPEQRKEIYKDAKLAPELRDRPFGSGKDDVHLLTK